VACSATARRPTGRNAGPLDRPARQHIPIVYKPSAAPGSGVAAAGPIVSASPPHEADEETSSEMTPARFWALLPAAEREQLGLRFSRLVLKALRPLDITEGR
jgi:hypothetical protein